MNKQRKVFVALLGLFLALVWTLLPVSAAPTTQGEDRQAQAEAFFSEGVDLYYAGEYQAALEKWQAALEIYRELGDRAGEGKALNVIGVVYEKLGQYQGALKVFEGSLTIKRELGDRTGEGLVLNNIGVVYKKLGQYQEALKAYEESLAIRHEIGDRTGEGNTLNSIGLIYKKLGHYQGALKYYEGLLAIKREMGDRAPTRGHEIAEQQVSITQVVHREDVRHIPVALDGAEIVVLARQRKTRHGLVHRCGMGCGCSFRDKRHIVATGQRTTRVRERC